MLPITESLSLKNHQTEGRLLHALMNHAYVIELVAFNMHIS
jgi:hypothetical protein